MNRMRTAILTCGLVILIGGLGAGCASPVPNGSFFAQLSLPVAATGNPTGSPIKVGVATCTSWFGVYATGDASIEAAMNNGNIKKIHHVDWEMKNILGMAKYKLIVHGE